jgi:hypothetical protein
MGFNEPITLREIAGFNARVDELWPQTGTIRAAYEKAEEEHEGKYNCRKYIDYDSFYSARKRWLGRKLKSNRWNSKPGFGRAA